MDTEFITYEVCPYCEEEVKLPAKLGIYTCPNCGKRIISCSMCTTFYCGNCKLYEEAECQNYQIENK